MALIVADRVVESSTTTGTGALTLAGAYTGYRRFSAVCSVADTVYYTIEAVDANGNPSGDWETGLGTYSSANTLTRTTVHASTNSNNAVNFAAGTKRVSLNVTSAQLAMTAAKLTDPNADRIPFWDDSAGIVDWLTPGTGLNINGTTMTAGLIGVQRITATGAGSYTPTTGTNSVVIELIGGGGGGGGIASPTGTNVAFARGGGGGAYLRKRLTANFSGASYSVGAKGAGGTAGANNGAAGSDTTFTDTAATVYTAGGGSGGNGASGVVAPNASGGVTSGGTATNGDLNVPGGPSSLASSVSASRVNGGFGGAGIYGASGLPGIVAASNTSAAGAAAGGKGGGGGGAAGTGTGANAAGGDGSDGMIIIWEYS